MSKILKMKAIHNLLANLSLMALAVVTMSKILKMKAIHNFSKYNKHLRKLL